jgi:8-oxo-dGTP pyrophosphatase MutT (NUDIX family)
MNEIADRLIERLNQAARDRSFPNVRPRDAATLILIDRSDRQPKVLLGRRHDGHKFMPGKFVFPGGRVEPIDRRIATATPLDPRIETRLMQRMQRPSRDKARGMALAAIRETFEETGLLLGVRRNEILAAPTGPWRAFAEAHIHPDLGAVHFIGRAITPPGRPRRFDTRFFSADARAIAHRVDGVIGPDAELVELVWLALPEAERLDMPAITTTMLAELQTRIAAGLSHDSPAPFYHWSNRRFLREML